MDRNVTLNYNSTLEGSVLELTCEFQNDTSINEQMIICHSSGNWIPDPTQFICSPSITVPSTTVPSTTVPPAAGTGLEIILGSVLGVLIFGAAVIITATSAIIFCLIKKGILLYNTVDSECPNTKRLNNY